MTFTVGQELPTSFSITVTPEMVQQYAEASGDYSAIHLDDAAARDSGFSGAIAHGMLSMGLCARLLAPFQGIVLRSFEARFAAPLLVGQTLLIQGWTERADKQTITLGFRGTNGDTIILQGTFMIEASPLYGQAAIITGSTRGIGKAIALRLAQAGASIVVNGRTQEGVDAIVADIVDAGGQAVGIAGPIEEMDTGARLVKAAWENFGRADILINNAGLTRDRMSYRMSEADWDEVTAVHLKGAFSCTSAFTQQLRAAKAPGTIINMISSAGWEGVPGQLNYSAAKAGLLAMTWTLAKELQRSNIRVYAVAPAALTDMTRPLVERAEAEAAAQGRSLDPYWKIGSAADVAVFVERLLAEGTMEDSGNVYAVNGTKAERLTWTLQRGLV